MLPLLAAGLLLCLGGVSLQKDLHTLPRVPVPKDGRTWRMEDHRKVAYGTFGETLRVYGLFVAALVVGAFGAEQEKQIRLQNKRSSRG